MRRRRVLIHYHIYKNAGSSVDAMLRACFKDKWGKIEGDAPTDVLSRERLEGRLREHPQWCAISSHLARPPVPSFGLPIIFLRHPILRARSAYGYSRRDHTQPDHHIAASHDFRGYVEWALDQGRSIAPIANYQTIHLSSASFRAAHIHEAFATLADLREAEALLNGLDVCGVVEEFALSCQRIEAAYRPYLPELTLPGAHENRSDGVRGSLREQLAAVAEELGPAVHSRLIALNMHDLRLHEAARRVLHRR